MFLDNYSYFEHRVLDRQIEELEDNKKYYKEEIKKEDINNNGIFDPWPISEARDGVYGDLNDIDDDIVELNVEQELEILENLPDDDKINKGDYKAINLIWKDFAKQSKQKINEQ